MKLKELILLPNCPEWLKAEDIKVSGEDVYLNHNNLLVWERGTWWKGTWQDGSWESGTWVNGTWKSGRWRRGTWHSGIWEQGVWEQGKWNNGVWYGGSWLAGDWHDGTWENGLHYSGWWLQGTWKNGRWYSGMWHGGLWYGGTWISGEIINGKIHPKRTTTISCRWSTFIDAKTNEITIGGLTKTIEDWDRFFLGDNRVIKRRTLIALSYTISRDSPEFELVFKAYLAARNNLRLLNLDTDFKKELLLILDKERQA